MSLVALWAHFELVVLSFVLSSRLLSFSTAECFVHMSSILGESTSPSANKAAFKRRESSLALSAHVQTFSALKKGNTLLFLGIYSRIKHNMCVPVQSALDFYVKVLRAREISLFQKKESQCYSTD